MGSLSRIEVIEEMNHQGRSGGFGFMGFIWLGKRGV